MVNFTLPPPCQSMTVPNNPIDSLSKFIESKSDVLKLAKKGEENRAKVLENYSGSCGTNVSWNLDKNTGVLAISGSGMMNNYYFITDIPWYSYRNYITSLIIEDGVTSIGDYAFQGCISLTRIVIPNSVTSIGQCAFSGCNRLTGITLPNGITSIGNSAFNECKSLVSVVIPNGVTSIERDTFSWCSNLSSVAIPNSVKSIGESAFFYCENLEKIYYAGSQENWATISISSGNEYLFAPTTILYNQTEPWR